MPKHQKKHITKVISLVVFAVVFAFLGSIAINSAIAAWVDAPNTPPNYGAVAGQQEQDFKPITKGAAEQYKEGVFGVSTNGIDNTYGLTVGNNAINGIKVKGDSFFENGGVTISNDNGGSRPSIKLFVDTSNTNNGADYWIKTLGTGGSTNVTNYIENWGGNYIWQIGSITGPIELLRLTAAGNVGIGTAAPKAKLDVKGDIGSNGILTSTQSIPNLGTPSWLKLGTWTNAIGGETLVLKYNGGRGYNNVAKQNSSTEISLRRSWNGSCSTICVNGYFYDWGAAGSIPQIQQVKVVQLGGANTQTFDVYIYTATYSGFDAWQAIHDKSSNFVWVNTAAADPGTAANVMSITNSVGVLKSAINILSSGNVGIGTATPAEKLDVTGNIKASGTICDGSGNCIPGAGASFWTAVGSDITNNNIGSVGIGTTGALDSAYNLIVGDTLNSKGLKVASGDSFFEGNVGIGVAPAEKLDVNGNIKALKIAAGNSTNNGNTSGIWLWNNADSNHVIYSANSQTGIRPGGSTVGDAPDNILGSAGTEHRLRFRTAMGQGWLFENKNNIGVIDFDSDNGDAYFGGILKASNISSAGTGNIFTGVGAGAVNKGNNNTFSGYQAGFSNIGGTGVQGSYNTFSGYRAGYLNTTGYYNTFSGTQAGFSNTTGYNNTFSGYQAGLKNTTGYNNIFSGYQAGFKNTTGYNNIFSGYQAGYENTTGRSNVFSGYQAGFKNTTGFSNTFSGYRAGFSNIGGTGVQGSYNTFSGYRAGYLNTTGYDNTFSGTQAGFSNTTGYYNTFSGTQAGFKNTTGHDNTFSGFQAGFSNIGGTGVQGSYNVFSGYQAGYNNVTGYRNVFSGYQAGYFNTIGNNNTFSGYQAGYNNIGGTGVQGSYNVFSGYQAGFKNTTGFNNVFSGYQAGFSNTTGYNNTFSGFQAGYNNIGGAGLQGSYNTFSGYQAGFSNTTGYNNTFSGTQAGFRNSIGSGNVFIGYRAGFSETGSNRLYIDNSNTISPLIWGNFATNTVRINGSLAWSSDRRLKENIKSLDKKESLDKILRLQGVSFDWKETEKKDIGLIAQDVEKVFPRLVETSETTGLKSLEYANLVAPLIEATKEQQKIIDEQKNRINSLEERILILENK